MSTGKRLAKRSIIGTRVCAPGDDGKFYSGVIHAVKTPGNIDIGNHVDTRYSVRFDPLTNGHTKSRISREYREAELIGPGFRAVTGCTLLLGQKVYLTYNGREISGEVTSHAPDVDEVVVNISPPGHEQGLAPMALRKRLEEVRLLESRKSLRLMDQDTDFARLADMAGDRKRASSNSIDVPAVQGSRKRRPSESGSGKDLMDECTAALVLMSLSCSPHSPQLNGYSWSEGHPPSPTSDAWSRGSTPSPPLSDGGNSTSSFWSQAATDEGIVCDQDFDDLPKKKKLHVDVESGYDVGTRVVFQCTWPGCLAITRTCDAIENHVRTTHLGPRKGTDDTELSDHEEEFYYTEVELGLHASSPPTLSHRDMARPPHEDPEYLKQLKNSFSVGLHRAGPINIPSSGAHMPWSSTATPSSLGSPGKHQKLSPRSGGLLSLSAPTSHKLSGSPTRKHRGDTKKCRKVYGMEHRELWCTQCKWKKACTRFGE